MAIWDRFRKKPEVKEIKEKIIEQTVDPQWTTLSMSGLGLEEKSATLLQEYVSWVYANISAIAEAVADIDFELYKVKKNGDLDEITEHPILEILHRPNPAMTKREFVTLLQIYRLLTGESPIRIKKVNGIVTELWPIDPLLLTPIVGKTGDGYEMIVKYELRDTTNGQLKLISLKPDEVIFIKNMNPRNPWRGYGVVEAAQKSIDTLHYSEQYNLNFFKNSAVPFMVLYTDQKLTDVTINRLKDSWKSSYQGIDNAFKTAILEAGLKVEKLQATSKDMDFIEQQRFLRDKLMAMFKTTKIALGITEDVNRANAEASEYVFSKNCVKPKMAQFVDSFNEFLLPLLDPKGELFLDFEDPVPKDRVAKVTEYSAAVDKWMTRNEIRDEEGLPPLEGGDEIWQAISLTTMSNPTPNTPEIQTTPQPTENQPNPNEPVEPQPEENPQEPKMYRVLRIKEGAKKRLPKETREKIIALKNRNIRLKQMKEELKNQLREILKSKIKPRKIVKNEPKYKDMRTKESTDLYIKSLMTNADRFEEKMNKEMKWKYYQPQMETIMNKLNRGTKFILTKSLKKIEKAVGDEFMFNEEQYVSTGIDLLTPLLKEIILTQGAEALLTVNDTMTYSLLDAARKYLNTKPTKLAKSITETAYTRIRSSLAEGIKAGESIAELKDRVLEGYKSLEIYQAEAIARTEVSRATNFAAIDAFKQSGVVEGKEWIVTPDDRLCEFCMAMESEYNSKIGLGENFFSKGDTVRGIEGGEMVLEFDDVEAPPLHVNCRCALKSVEKLVQKKVEPEKKKSRDDELLDEIEKELENVRGKTAGTEKEDSRKDKKE